MLCKDNMVNVDYKSKKNNANTFFLSFPFFLKIFFIKRNNKNTYHEMHKCYAMQILKQKETKKTATKKGHKE